MLQEFHGVQQERGVASRRRWFQDDGMDLIVWYGAASRVEGFQICYRGADQRERALTWREEEGFSHARVDSGDSRPDKNLTPILVRDEVVSWEQVEADFAARAGSLEPAVRELILKTFAQRS